MSEPKLISPLLDGFSIGNPISEHHGVRCCPALKENSTKKYIVKIISIPASQVQLDALLLTGAYREPSAALDYFREVSEGVEKEAKALKNLAKLEGFLAYDRWQVVTMEHGELGYEVYLLGSYRRSLERYLRRETMTHLGAVNLGIDICDALSAARRTGWIYVDLKPSNIFISEGGEYRIGDLGLLELADLELAALPGKYRSSYTPPELEDELRSPDTTIDTYALGMILYQIYNNGQLPQVPHPEEDLPAAPANADADLAEILLKAIHPDPAQRWEDPARMGQALVAYMQRTRVNNDPILPPQEIPEPPAQEPEIPQGEPEVPQEDPAPREVSPEEEVPTEPSSPDPLPQEPREEPREPGEESDDLLAQVDALIAHEVPELGEILPKDPEGDSKPQESAEPVPQPKAPPADTEQDLNRRRVRSRRRVVLIPLLIGLIIALLGGSALWYYREVYLLRVDGLSVTGSENRMTVLLDTQFDNSILQITCTDTQGKTHTAPVIQGQAEFDNLLPDMLYEIQVQVEGFHRLSGSTTHAYTTPAETHITGFTAATGSEDGSVILSFDVEGPDSEEWIVSYQTGDEPLLTRRFTGHTVHVTGLTVGKTYTLRMEPVNDLYLTGPCETEFTASPILFAGNIRILSQEDGSLTVTWDAPEGAEVPQWDLLCYSTDGYEQRLTTSDLTATFSGIHSGSAYTVEITAAGMTQPARASISADPIRITGVNVSPRGSTELAVSWEFQGEAPNGGWLLMYTIDGNGKQQVVQCPNNSGILEVRVPGAEYEFTIQSADGRTVFDGSHRYTAPEADKYSNADQALFARELPHLLFVNLFKTPDKTNWNHTDVHRSQFADSFARGDSISVQLYYMSNFYIRHENIQLLYVIRDEAGKVVSDCIAMENRDWRDGLWNGPDYHYCCLTLPHVPENPGNYSFSLYFNGQLIAAENFTIQP